MSHDAETQSSHVPDVRVHYPAGKRTRHLPAVQSQEASAVEVRHLDSRAYVPSIFTPGSTNMRSVHPSFDTAAETMSDLENVGQVRNSRSEIT